MTSNYSSIRFLTPLVRGRKQWYEIVKKLVILHQSTAPSAGCGHALVQYWVGEAALSVAQKLTTVSMLCYHHLCHTHSTSSLPWGSILLNTEREVSATWRIIRSSLPCHHCQDFSQHFHYTSGFVSLTAQATDAQNQWASLGWLVQTSQIPYPWA